MDQPPEDPWLGVFSFVLLAASLVTWYTLISRWRDEGQLLQREPRPLVPWGAPVALLAVVFMGIALYSVANGDAAAEEAGPLQIAQQLLSFIIFQSVVIGSVLLFVAVYYRANLRDFGLPLYTDQLARDVALGIVACLAAVAPVYGIQLLLLTLLGPSEHPLVQMVTSGDSSYMVVFLATVAAVVVAPVSEEVLFRLLLQGWLEKREDLLLRWRHGSMSGEPLNEENGAAESDFQDSESRMTRDEDHDESDSSSVARAGSSPAAQPPARGLVGWPYGWTPILVSSLLFAVAHYGYGPDPVPIFFLAIILGYIYQRTHRILPCIVAHALFNSIAMLILWRMVLLDAE